MATESLNVININDPDAYKHLLGMVKDIDERVKCIESDIKNHFSKNAAATKKVATKKLNGIHFFKPDGGDGDVVHAVIPSGKAKAHPVVIFNEEQLAKLMEIFNGASDGDKLLITDYSMGGGIAQLDEEGEWNITV